jgi:hypothetical protein
VADTRACDQCGIVFTPRREHSRFCCAACRIAWNQEHTGDPQAEASALDWSISAMREAVGRLAREQARDQAHGFEVISDAVWRVTLVDATLVRYHPLAYQATMRAQDPAAWPAVEGTLAGLRFVRNWMGYHADPAEFIRPEHSRPGAGHGIAAWRWRSLPEPALASLPPRGQAWEMTRYRAYQAYLAADTVGETFGRAATFLKLAFANSAGDGAVGPYLHEMPPHFTGIGRGHVIHDGDDSRLDDHRHATVPEA